MVKKIHRKLNLSSQKDSPQLKVLILTSYDFNGRYFQDFANVLSQYGQKMSIMSLSDLGASKWAGNSDINDLTVRHCRNGLFRSIKQFIAVRKFEPEVIQSHLFKAGVIGLLFSKMLGIKFILTRHHIDEHVQAGSFFHRLIDRLSAKTADHVVVFSQAAKKWMIEMESIEPHKISVINQGFNFENFEPSSSEIDLVKKELKLDPEYFNILCIARYSKTKGQVYLVQAMSKLLADFKNIRLSFVGPGDPSWLIRYINELGLEQYISCMSSRNDIAACIAAADLIVHPSLVDSFSQLIIEAQAVGSTLIATDIAAAKEQIVHERTGIIIAPRDSDAIYNAVKHLYLNPDIRKNLVLEARKHVREKFTLNRMYQEQISCYKRVLGAGSTEF